MALTPTGRPAWERASDIASYGGNVNKRNHLSQGVVDPETDLGAEDHGRMAADLAAVARVTPFATITYTCNDTGTAAPTVNAVLMMTGVNVAGYEGDAAPSGMPSMARNGDGDVTITFASSYSDPYAVSGAFAVSMAIATSNSASGGQCAVELVSDTTIRVRQFDKDGTADTDESVTVQVW